jgi:Protein of unknown function (DUF3575)
MKKIIFFTVFFAQTIYCFAQLEVKINPLGALLSNPDASVEFSPTKGIAFEPFASIIYANTEINRARFTSNGYTLGVMGKYYFVPIRGFDRIYFGIYALKGTVKYKGLLFVSNQVFTNNYEIVGGSVGYKWVFNNNIVLDFSGAIGKRIGNKYEDTNNNNLNFGILVPPNVDYMLRLGIGYRFSFNFKKGSFKEDF